MYQQVWIIGDSSKEAKVVKPRRKAPKTTTGCMNCKKRRKKCDEVKPSCTRCSKSEICCYWPDHVVDFYNRTNRDIGVSLIGNSDHQGQGANLITPTSNTQQCVQLQDDSGTADMFDPHQFMDGFSVAMGGDILDIDFTNSDYLLDQFKFIQTENQAQSSSKSPVSVTSAGSNGSGSLKMNSISTVDNGQLYDIPGVNMSKYDKMCYSYFIDKFLLTITPPHCNQLITPVKILLPFMISNDIVREIFLTCGASLLAYSDDSYAKRASERYINSVNLLIQEIQGSKYGAEDHLFICAQLLQTLCLRDKNVGSNATKCAAHLSASYEIIKKRFIRNSFNLQNFTITPLDRILSEHFVFNYPVTILLCHSDRLFQHIIPSPFQFFEQFNDILNQPFSASNDDPWLNHPVLGVSLKCYELSAKCSWICRFFRKSLESFESLEKSLLVNRYVEMLTKMKAECLEDTERLKNLSLSPTLKDSERLNVSITKMGQLANLMVVERLLYELADNTDITTLKPNFAQQCQEIVEETRYSYTLSVEPYLDSWTFFVLGVMSVDVQVRELIAECSILTANTANSSLSLKILKFLRVYWESDAVSDSTDNDGFEVLLDGSTLDMICV
ncbi:hypothetical protein WICPIJ_009132 [Wickerhamomyces pijperi]|uniref:Zn(2)-C6 fungal-type domain-containing protein n=1 Tax=Wickerhamomyces pijperi TaxID=599730 RepID=A0A9P8TEX0_WICPI|nr:hypothetical protein WICPIJ_009132 [Wickerhamomyces pijperi]